MSNPNRKTFAFPPSLALGVCVVVSTSCGMCVTTNPAPTDTSYGAGPDTSSDTGAGDGANDASDAQASQDAATDSAD